MFSLKNKVAIVTGAEGGIGKAIVNGFEKAEAKVYGLDKKSHTDITDSESIKKLLDIIYKKEKRIDILINCAGITLPEKAEIYNKQDWHKTLLVNLDAPFTLSQAAFKYMKRKGGSIINITSLFSELGFPHNPAYGASKGGLKQLSKCLAVEWAKYGIRVNNLGLGYMRTAMTQKSWNDERSRKQRTSRIPMGRWGRPEDAVGAAIFLASDASKYITGQDFYVDGGWLAKGI